MDYIIIGELSGSKTDDFDKVKEDSEIYANKAVDITNEIEVKKTPRPKCDLLSSLKLQVKPQQGKSKRSGDSKCKTPFKKTTEQRDQQHQGTTVSARAKLVSPRSKSETKPRPGTVDSQEIVNKRLLFEQENPFICSKYKTLLLESKQKEEASKISQQRKRPITGSSGGGAGGGGGNRVNQKPLSPVLSLLGWKTAKLFLKK